MQLLLSDLGRCELCARRPHIQQLSLNSWSCTLLSKLGLTQIVVHKYFLVLIAREEGRVVHFHVLLVDSGTDFDDLVLAVLGVDEELRSVRVGHPREDCVLLRAGVRLSLCIGVRVGHLEQTIVELGQIGVGEIDGELCHIHIVLARERKPLRSANRRNRDLVIVDQL